MKDLLALPAHLLTTIAKLLGPGGARTVVADSPLMKQQLLIINRSRQRSPNPLRIPTVNSNLSSNSKPHLRQISKALFHRP
jgi:hypothetical protein